LAISSRLTDLSSPFRVGLGKEIFFKAVL